MAAIDAENAKDFNDDDRVCILGLMKKSDGVFNVNTRVLEEMRRWILYTGKVHYNQEVKAGSKAMALGSNLASLYIDLGEPAEAESLYEKSRKGFLEEHGEQHSTTLSAVFNLAVVKLKLGSILRLGRVFGKPLERNIQKPYVP